MADMSSALNAFDASMENAMKEIYSPPIQDEKSRYECVMGANTVILKEIMGDDYVKSQKTFEECFFSAINQKDREMCSQLAEQKGLHPGRWSSPVVCVACEAISLKDPNFAEWIISYICPKLECDRYYSLEFSLGIYADILKLGSEWHGVFRAFLKLYQIRMKSLKNVYESGVVWLMIRPFLTTYQHAVH